VSESPPVAITVARPYSRCGCAVLVAFPQPKSLAQDFTPLSDRLQPGLRFCFVAADTPLMGTASLIGAHYWLATLDCLALTNPGKVLAAPRSGNSTFRSRVLFRGVSNHSRAETFAVALVLTMALRQIVSVL
jgi:hypothetical protein